MANFKMGNGTTITIKHDGGPSKSFLDIVITHSDGTEVQGFISALGTIYVSNVFVNHTVTNDNVHVVISEEPVEA